MTEKTAQLIKPPQISKNNEDVRIVPLLVAVIVCFSFSVILGAGSWFVFNLYRSQQHQTAAETIPPKNPQETEIAISPESLPKESLPEKPLETILAANTNVEANANSQPTDSTTLTKPIENTVEVSAGEIALGGGDTKQPLQRTFVKDFLIAETEVTNAQYAEFLKETGYPSPVGWNKALFPKGTENYPVVNVSWKDANAFCEWMSKKIGLPVRLPTEAEWEMAARGKEGFKYPWGNEWSKKAVTINGKVSSVKSYPLNRSPFGAFDMAGSVWEWTQEKVESNATVKDERVKKNLDKGREMRIVKGGAADEDSTTISGQSRYEVPENTKDFVIGFRYIVERK